jgi:hypothetical protein
MSLSGNDDAAGSQFWSILGLRPTPASGVNGVGIGEYEGVVRVPRQAFHRFIDGTATPERCVEAYQSSASHGFGAHRRAQAAQSTAHRRRQRRDNRARPARRCRCRRCTGVQEVRDVAASSKLMIGEAARRFPARIRIAVPPDGLGRQLTDDRLARCQLRSRQLGYHASRHQGRRQ